MSIALTAAVIELVMLYVFLIHFPEQGVHNVLFAALIGYFSTYTHLASVLIISTATCCCSTAWVFQPKHWKQFGIGTKSAWNWTDESFRSLFVVESGWMIGYDVLLDITQY